MAADSLVARHRAMPQGGWAWRSAIQAPHYQTDRDVGAASIGEGLLAAYAVTHDPRYKRAAVEAGDYLLGVAEPAGGRTAVARLGGSGAGAARRRTSRASTTAPPGSATTSGGCSSVTRAQRFRAGALEGMRWVVAQAEGPACPQAVVLVALDRRPLLARRLQRRRHGSGRHRPGARRLRGSHRGSDLPRLRARRRRPPAHRDRRRRAPAAAGVRGRRRRDRVPLRLGGRGVHVPRAIPARPRSPRPRHRAPAAGLGERAGGRRRARAGCAGRSRATTRPARRGSSWVPRASPGSTCTRPVRPATRDTSTSRAERRSG